MTRPAKTKLDIASGLRVYDPFRMSAQVPKSIEELFNPVIRGVDAVLRNVFPNGIQILRGGSAENALLHALDRFRSLDFP